jgi:hypothetical protein
VPRMRARLAFLLLLAAGLSLFTNSAANSATQDHDQGIRLFSTRSPALVFTASGNGVRLGSPTTAAAGRWDVFARTTTPTLTTLYTYRNQATGTCLTAQSPIDGMVLLLATCDATDPHQQWSLWNNSMTTESDHTRCARTEQMATGARVYYDKCDSFGSDETYLFSDAFRVKLNVVSGNNQQVKAGTTGAPLVVKVTDEDGNPVPGVTVSYQLCGPFFGGECSQPPVTFGSAATATVITGADGVAASPALQGVRNASGTYFGVLTAGVHSTGDVFLLQTGQFTGTVVK